MTPRALPSLTVVTPSFQQVRFLGRALSSVAAQRYPGLEHLVVDGGSTDGSVEVVERHARDLAWWVSEPDAGQYFAIQKGFDRSSGEVMAWLNSDDLYLPQTLLLVGRVFADLPEVEWLTTSVPLVCDEDDVIVEAGDLIGLSSREVLRGSYLPGGWWHAVGTVQQESTFWRRSLWERAGATLDTTLGLAADFDLWLRFAQLAEVHTVDVPLGVFRRHAAQKTASGVAAYFAEASEALVRRGGAVPSRRAAARRRVADRLLGAPASRRRATPLTRLLAGGTHAGPARRVLCGADGRWRVAQDDFV